MSELNAFAKLSVVVGAIVVLGGGLCAFLAMLIWAQEFIIKRMKSQKLFLQWYASEWKKRQAARLKGERR